MTTISDDFNRADNATTLGSTSVGAVAWQALQGTWGIGTNRAHVVTGDATSPTEQVAVIPTGSPDGTVQTTIAAVDGSGISPFVIFRAFDRLNYLYWVVNTGAIRKMVAGSSSLVGTAAGVTAGDVVKVVMSGASVECFINGSSVGAFTIFTHSTHTKHGIGNDSTVTGNYFDDFSFTPAVRSRGWVVGGIGWGGTAATPLALVDVKTAQHPFGFSSIDVGIPSGDVGDLLILIHTGFNDTSDPTGWTALTDVIASGTSLNCRLSVWTRVADGTEGSSVTLTDSADSDVGACLRYSGVGSYTDTTWSSTNIADGITTPTASANAGDVVLSIWAWEEINTSAALTVTTDAAVTALVPKVQWDQACLAVGEETAATTGTTTGRTASATNASSGASRCAMTIVLSP